MTLLQATLPVPLNRPFDYILPSNMNAIIGARVLVPFGRQKKVGIVTGFPTKSEFAPEQLKSVIAVLDEESLFNSAMWNLLHWAADYYQAPLGEVLLSALPVKLRQGESAVENQKIFLKLTALGQQVLADCSLKRAKKQLEALQSLAISPIPKDTLPIASHILSALKNKGLVEEFSKNQPRLSWQQQLGKQPIANAEDRLTLNKAQALVFSQLHFQQGFKVSLLDGVTGSGKTEIYLQLIEETLKKGKQALVLVPEIGLTPQTVQRFKARFNVEIDVLHSNLNDNQRLQVWQRARTGQSAIVIGTRSALFTQFTDLGLIVIDEEHDGSFKQQEGWRYHARDLAIVLAKQLDIPILLGSATPSLESLKNVQTGKYQYLQLQNRVNPFSKLNQQVIDLKQQRIFNGLSAELLARMKTHLEQGNQVLLFLNRRGFAPVLLCHECGWIAQCQHCDKPYTYHQHQRALRCHHCGAQRPIPRQCPHCGSTHFITTGLGTEQLESTLREHFPKHNIVRIDRDTTSRKGKLEQYLADIQQGKSQILIGTQMLAKGHHFPNVTLVGLVNVDNALFSLDFRAEERLAQLYIQVIGRAGRGTQQGEVILQTHYPEHPLLQTLTKEGYAAFAKQALAQRQLIGLPPFSAQALFNAQSRQSESAMDFLENFAEFFTELNMAGLQILGPIPAPFSKKGGQFRWQLLLQHASKLKLQKALKLFHQRFDDKNTNVRWSLDVDPLDLA